MMEKKKGIALNIYTMSEIRVMSEIRKPSKIILERLFLPVPLTPYFISWGRFPKESNI